MKKEIANQYSSIQFKIQNPRNIKSTKSTKKAANSAAFQVKSDFKNRLNSKIFAWGWTKLQTSITWENVPEIVGSTTIPRLAALQADLVTWRGSFPRADGSHWLADPSGKSYKTLGNCQTRGTGRSSLPLEVRKLSAYFSSSISGSCVRERCCLPLVLFWNTFENRDFCNFTGVALHRWLMINLGETPVLLSSDYLFPDHTSPLKACPLHTNPARFMGNYSSFDESVAEFCNCTRLAEAGSLFPVLSYVISGNGITLRRTPEGDFTSCTGWYGRTQSYHFPGLKLWRLEC